MRIYGPHGAAAATPAPAARRVRTSGFVVPQDEASSAPSLVGAPRTLGGIDALIALQGVDDPAERRRRAVGRGRIALDALDDLKLGLLAGTLDRTALDRLRAAAADLKSTTGDQKLDEVLAEIDLRVEVELAKMNAGAAV